MITIEVANGVTGYWRLLAKVLQRGKLRSPRGLKTYDAGPMTVVMWDTSASLPLQIGRNLNKRIAAVEALQLIGQFSSPELTVGASPNFQRFRESNGTFHGAYGRRIQRQLNEIVHKLRQDRDTRQAGMTLWDPWLDNQPGKLDYPCTVAIWFAIVNDTLELTVFMRSQDVWWGSPYDWFQFSQLQRTVAGVLDVEPGAYRHTTVSTHIYDEFVEAAERIIVTEPGPELKTDRAFQPDRIGRPGDTTFVVKDRAAHIGAGYGIEDPTESEQWYIDQVTEIMKDAKT